MKRNFFALPTPIDNRPSVLSLFATLDSLESIDYSVNLKIKNGFIYVTPEQRSGEYCSLKTESNEITWDFPKVITNLSNSINLLKRELTKWIVNDRYAECSYHINDNRIVFTLLEKQHKVLEVKEKQEKRLLIIDGSNTLSVCYYGSSQQGEDKLMMSPVGLYTNGIYTMVRKILNLIRDYRPSHLAICWDIDRETFRKKLFPEYKALRDDTPVPLKKQFETARILFKEMNIAQYSLKGYEADDLIGSIQKKWTDEGYECFIVSNDKDLFQLLNQKTTLIRSTKAGVQRFSLKDFTNIYHINPEKWIDVKAILGEQGKTSDNIPGIYGVGDRAAYPLIQRFGSLEGIYENLESLKDDKQFKRYFKHLEKGREIGFISKELATIKTVIPDFDVVLDDVEMKIDKTRMFKSFETLGFHSITKDIYAGKFSIR